MSRFSPSFVPFLMDLLGRCPSGVSSIRCSSNAPAALADGKMLVLGDRFSFSVFSQNKLSPIDISKPLLSKLLLALGVDKEYMARHEVWKDVASIGGSGAESAKKCWVQYVHTNLVPIPTPDLMSHQFRRELANAPSWALLVAIQLRRSFHINFGVSSAMGTTAASGIVDMWTYIPATFISRASVGA
ncbi:hypothetical protein HGRIS_003044 [Hohenbuehelia grisea]|uniref:Uncharacterized protein n=1 Tax=Hohenbuehelia grisea TaxID=104357 RepID=A0ABR3JNN6_9AGAR